MSTSSTRQTAEFCFNTGYALFLENHFEQALFELRKAEDAFRKLDSRGYPFNITLANGVSGLANALTLSGRCHQRLDNWEQAATCFETGLINSKYEKPKFFKPFLQSLNADLAICYSRALEQIDQRTLADLLLRDVAINTSFCFPFSLDKNVFPLARLYELVPEQYPQFKDFYHRAREKNKELERLDEALDQARLKKAGISIWVALGALWALYTLLASKALLYR